MSFNSMTAVIIHSSFGAQKNKVCHYSHFFPICFPDAVIFAFWMLSLKPAFSLSSFTFIKRLFIKFLFAFCIRMVIICICEVVDISSSNLIPACASASQVFHMMHCEYQLNKQGDNIQPWCTHFPFLNQSIIPCPDITLASWPAYRFLRRQVRFSGIPICVCVSHSVESDFLWLHGL